jgi:hypothetical protein
MQLKLGIGSRRDKTQKYYLKLDWRIMMVKRIEAETFIKYLGNDKSGMSKPICILGNDGRKYILKTQNVYTQGNWKVWNSTFFNELFVYHLAKYLNINIPEAVIVNVDKSFLHYNPKLTFESHFVPGIHFGSELINNSEENKLSGYQQLIHLGKPYVKRSWSSFFNKISNKDDIAKIITLDLLTGNFDRFGNDGNLLIASNNNTRKLYAIDHGHCFYGPSWEIGKQRFLLTRIRSSGDIISYINEFFKLNSKKLSGMGIIFQAVEQYVDVADPNNHSFIEPVYALENLSQNKINSWLESIPDEWYIDKQNQITSHSDFILAQKGKIRYLIECLVNNGAFSNTTGGVLNWKEKKTGTQ